MKKYTVFLIQIVAMFLFSACAAPPHPTSISPTQQNTAISTPPQNTDSPVRKIAQKPAVMQDDSSDDIDDITDEDIEAFAEEEDSDTCDASETKDTESLTVGENDLADDDSEDAEDPELVSIHPVFEEAMDFCEKAQELWKSGDSDKALASLDNAYSRILGVDTEDDAELGRQKEDLRFLISKRILEIYASRNTAAKGKYDAIPMIMNHHVAAEIEILTSPGKDGQECFFYKAYRRSGRYHAMIAEEMKKAGLPVELAWLPLIESGFQDHALSPARALGIWQFIPSTGYKYGLKRDRYVDERMDPEKSTKAAIEYLKELHQIFGDWATVLAAYNCGEGRVLREIRQQNINYLDNFWDLYEKLPRETARYVPRFLATLHILKEPEKYGLDKVLPHPALEYETVEISKMVRISDLAQALNIDKDTLASLNPELRHQIVPDSSYLLKVPKDSAQNLLAKLDEIPVSSPPQVVQEPSYQYHKVGRKESLASVAKRYGVSAKRLARLNRLGKRARVVAGDMLKIPRSKKAAAGSSYTESASSADGRYVVRKGDSVAGIAKRYGISPKAIYQANHLPKKKIRVGQTLRIPADKDKKIAQKANFLKLYRVKSGDSLSDIAKQHNMSVERILKVNNLTQTSKIRPGQQLYVE